VLSLVTLIVIGTKRTSLLRQKWKFAGKFILIRQQADPPAELKILTEELKLPSASKCEVFIEKELVLILLNNFFFLSLMLLEK
jgi:hypothetical protein